MISKVNLGNLGIALMCLFMSSISYAQLAPPSITCVSVSPSGDVTLNWQAPSDPNGVFFNYEIFANTGSGFVSLGPYGGINNTTYTYVGTNANTTVISFYITTLSNGGADVSQPSDTVSSILMKVNTNGPSIASLSWNDPGSIVRANSSGQFKIFREYPVGNIIQIASVPADSFSYQDTLWALCATNPQNVSYYVELGSQHGCTSTSSVGSNAFQDQLAPPTPQVETVSVDPATGHIVVYWYPVHTPDMDYYLVQKVDGTTYINLAQVPATDPPQYDYGAAPPDGGLSFVVIAFDSCHNDNSYNQVYSTMYLQQDYNKCKKRVTLHWSSYDGWPEGIEKYVLYESVNGAPAAAVQNLDPGTQTTTVQVTPFSDYCFYIEAISNGTQRPSYSNQKCLTAEYPSTSQTYYLSNVTAELDNTLDISLRYDAMASGQKFDLLRSIDPNGPFKTIATLPQDSAGGLEISYHDADVDASSVRYYYKWIAYDACGQVADTSQMSSSIFAYAAADKQDLINKISWNAYEGWSGDVTGYDIYRRLGNTGSYNLLASVGPNTLYYNDPVQQFIEKEGNFCYRIMAIEGSGNAFNDPKKAFSNVSCATQEPLIWIPNAIVLDGFNKIFKPVAGFLDFTRYQMKIVNRWGQVIFTSNSLDQGWDGTQNGKRVLQGVYFYFITFYDGAGNNYIRKGDLYVLY